MEQHAEMKHLGGKDVLFTGCEGDTTKMRER